MENLIYFWQSYVYLSLYFWALGVFTFMGVAGTVLILAGVGRAVWEAASQLIAAVRKRTKGHVLNRTSVEREGQLQNAR